MPAPVPLFWKLLPYGAAVVALLLAVWYIDHRGYKRAEQQNLYEAALEAKTRADMKSELIEQVGNVQTGLTNTVNEIDGRVGARLGKLNIEERTIVQPTIMKEIRNAPRLTDPAAGITDGLRGAINTARSASRRPCPTGSNAAACFSLPEPEPAAGQHDSDPGN